MVASTEAKPTAQSYEVYRILAAALDVELAKLTALLGGGLDTVNAELVRLGLDPVAK